MPSTQELLTQLVGLEVTIGQLQWEIKVVTRRGEQLMWLPIVHRRLEIVLGSPKVLSAFALVNKVFRISHRDTNNENKG